MYLIFSTVFFSQRYLLQIFTRSLFEEDTFFLEVVQRQGARGFGFGNVSAFFRAVEEERLLNQKYISPPVSLHSMSVT